MLLCIRKYNTLFLLGLLRFWPWPRDDNDVIISSTGHRHHPPLWQLPMEQEEEMEEKTQRQERWNHQSELDDKYNNDYEWAPPPVKAFEATKTEVRKSNRSTTKRLHKKLNNNNKTKATTRGKSKATTTIRTTTTTTTRVMKTPLKIDWLSVGSNTRSDLLQLQQDLYGQSGWIRRVFTATEEDDTDQTCRHVLTTADTLAVADFCQHRKKDASLPDGAKWVISDQLRYMLLNVTQHPVGWLCAQRRFALGLAKVLRQYQQNHHSKSATTTTTATTSSLSLPDYLMIVDDDTYYHLPKFISFLAGKNSTEDFMIPGVSYWLSMKPRFRIYHGGFGLTMSRGALRHAMQPIYCHRQSLNMTTTTTTFRQEEEKEDNKEFQGDEHLFCSRLRENWMGEYHVFRNGMSLIDLVETYVTTWEPFSSFHNWTTGFCFHGDWVLTYFFSYAYRVGTMHQPYCKFFCREWKAGDCYPDSHICHHVSVETIQQRASLWR